MHRELASRMRGKIKFNMYGEHLLADLRDMHGLCTKIIAQEVAKWYAAQRSFRRGIVPVSGLIFLPLNGKALAHRIFFLAEVQNGDSADRLVSK